MRTVSNVHRAYPASTDHKNRSASAVPNRRARIRTVTQAEVDLWDGFAITFFEQFVEAAEAARAMDPRIPAPSIIGLRSWFRRTGRKKAEESGSGEGGTPS